MKLSFKTFIVFCFMGLANMVTAQDCSDLIEEANHLYENGQFQEVIQKLSGCANTENTVEKWKRHRLLAMTYLGTQDNPKAREEAIKMLAINPTYNPSALNDPSDLIRLLKSITIIPKFSLGFALSTGTNSTFPVVTDAYMVADQIKHYKGKNSFQFGASSSFQFNQNFALQVNLMSSIKSYSMDYSYGDWDLRMQERLTYLTLPIFVRYLPSLKSRVRPFAQFGGYSGVLLASNNSFYATYKLDNSETSLEKVSGLGRRKQVDYGWNAGAGMFYKLNHAHVSLSVNYFHSATNITNTAKRFDFDELYYSFFHIDDDLRLNNLAISIGYVKYFNYKVLKSK